MEFACLICKKELILSQEPFKIAANSLSCCLKCGRTFHRSCCQSAKSTKNCPTCKRPNLKDNVANLCLSLTDVTPIDYLIAKIPSCLKEKLEQLLEMITLYEMAGGEMFSLIQWEIDCGLGNKYFYEKEICRNNRHMAEENRAISEFIDICMEQAEYINRMQDEQEEGPGKEYRYEKEIGRNNVDMAEYAKSLLEFADLCIEQADFLFRETNIDEGQEIGNDKNMEGKSNKAEDSTAEENMAGDFNQLKGFTCTLCNDDLFRRNILQDCVQQAAKDLMICLTTCGHVFHCYCLQKDPSRNQCPVCCKLIMDNKVNLALTTAHIKDIDKEMIPASLKGKLGLVKLYVQNYKEGTLEVGEKYLDRRRNPPLDRINKLGKLLDLRGEAMKAIIKAAIEQVKALERDLKPDDKEKAKEPENDSTKGKSDAESDKTDSGNVKTDCDRASSPDSGCDRAASGNSKNGRGSRKRKADEIETSSQARKRKRTA